MGHLNVACGGRSRPTSGCSGAGAAKAGRYLQRRRVGPLNLGVRRLLISSIEREVCYAGGCTL
jgi:hypothetical protein